MTVVELDARVSNLEENLGNNGNGNVLISVAPTKIQFLLKK